MLDSEEIFSIYSIFSELDEAKRIVRTLLEEKLIVCANMIPAVQSMYVWNGNIEESSEVLTFFKTTGLYVEAVTARIKELHSYEVPCIVVLPIVSGNKDYLDWVRNSL